MPEWTDTNGEGKPQQYTDALMEALARLTEAGRTGDLSIAMENIHLPPEEGKIIQLVNEAVSNYRNATEYDLMKYKLSGDALDIALWDLIVDSSDPDQPVYQFTWSPEFRQMLGFTDERSFTNVMRSWSDRLHPDDKERVMKAFSTYLSDYTNEKPYDMEYRLKVKEGHYRYFRAFGAAHRDQNGVLLKAAGALMDIDERVKTERLLEQREKMLVASAEMAAIFSSHDYRRADRFDELIKKGLSPVADAVNLDRIVIYRFVDAGAGERFGQIYRWDKLRGGRISMNSELMVLPNYPVMHNWLMVLSAGMSINTHASMMTMLEFAFLRIFGVKSLLLSPVFIQNELWGCVAFQDITNERQFDDACVHFMSTAAHVWVNAIIRNEEAKR
ncbi:MAG: PAS domain-containing protein [Clostridiales bacterium]|nr:PAS domain-containing protein [Clostridiales bacterium]